MRTSAHVTPRSVRALRFVCDTTVPSFLVHGVRFRDEVLDGPGGRSMSVEWVMPHEGAGKADNASPRASAIASPGAGEASPSDFPRIMLYLHGGAYVLCKPSTLRGVTAPVARSLGTALCVPDYRRPPEFTLDGALEDALAAYRHLVNNYPNAEIFLGGESAGGGLAASLLVAVQKSELPPPRGVLLMSPWTDLGGEGEAAGLRNASLHNSQHDYLPPDMINVFAGWARGELHHDSAPVSPVHAEGPLEDLPPIFVLYGSNEILCGQIEHFCEVWRGKGARVQQHGVKGGLHAPVLFQFCHGDSLNALDELKRFFSDECSPKGQCPDQPCV
eukprot:CAMPEP_0204537884 /NCGR_PEP_ID=MMETSP0661-20131031/15575_1 /ASSEMBLY_ACC=CAM_ASM_000606 /TAXON_ID=109239 /ORGANISM="Alexandrium margalefi, Strain AMGDE01CS-322" /LENGTH=330 /DNA_ID=CAMNT_0051544461 /DNA_START=95 /DNA_END=1087 /DNA_ORIENTATION=+